MLEQIGHGAFSTVWYSKFSFHFPGFRAVLTPPVPSWASFLQEGEERNERAARRDQGNPKPAGQGNCQALVERN